MRLADALNQLYVLLPVLDDAKHYWMASDEVDKLIRAGESWLAAHPATASLITRRYFGRRSSLTRTAFAGWPRSATTSRTPSRRPPDEEVPRTRSASR